MVTEIRIVEVQTYCGYGKLSAPSETVRRVVPFQITRRYEIRVAWGWIANYEVCIGSEQIETRQTLPRIHYHGRSNLSRL
jgi:hypothetical protein